MDAHVSPESNKEHIRSRSYAVRFVLIAFGLAALFLVLLILALNPISDSLQEKKDRKTAERNYDKYYSKVADLVVKESKEYLAKNPDGEIRELDRAEEILDILTLGEYSASDPRRYDDAAEYVRDRIRSHYSAFSLGEAEPEKIIGLGIVNGKSRSEIIDELIDDEKESRWFGNDNAAASVILIAAILLILMIPAGVISVIAACILVKCRYVDAADDRIYFGNSQFIMLTQVKDVCAKGFGKLIIHTPDKRFKYRFLCNNREIAEFISKRCTAAHDNIQQ